MSFAALAAEMTGATISATTAGRMPRKMADTTRLPLMRSGVRNRAMQRIMTNEGMIVPSAAATLPRLPRRLSPTLTAMFTARMPGRL